MQAGGVFFVALFTSALTAFGTVYAVERYHLIPKAEEAFAVVPNLNGLTEGEARAALHAVNLALFKASTEVSASAKPGTVLRQSVPAGQRLPPAHAVTVVLAEELPKTPELVGLTREDATARAQQAGYALQLGEPVNNATQPAGAVVEQSPPAATPYEKSKAIVVRLAAAPAAVEMPNEVGQSTQRAKDDLEKLGLKVKLRWISVAETATYVVLNQKPAAGTQLKPGDEVELSANR